MPSELRLSGVDELLAELAHLAPDLAAEARPLQDAIAAETAQTLRAAYPIGETGHLRASVKAARDTSISPVRVFTQITVEAPYVEFYEFGTRRTEPHPTFVPIVRRGREQFLDAIIARVKAKGLTVGGEVNR